VTATAHPLGNLGRNRRYGLSSIRTVRDDFRWLCPGCGWPVPAGSPAYEVSRDMWRCIDCASPIVEVDPDVGPPAGTVRCQACGYQTQRIARPDGTPYDNAPCPQCDGEMSPVGR
jgi:hypothetical protein